jgi:hypothetical protein
MLVRQRVRHRFHLRVFCDDPLAHLVKRRLSTQKGQTVSASFSFCHLNKSFFKNRSLPPISPLSEILPQQPRIPGRTLNFQDTRITKKPVLTCTLALWSLANISNVAFLARSGTFSSQMEPSFAPTGTANSNLASSVGAGIAIGGNV